MIKVKRCITIAIQLVIGVRKLLLALLWMALGLTLLALNQITGTEYIETTRDVTVAFLATNMAEHLAKTISEWGKKRNEK